MIRVVIVGAGPAGMAAAYTLSNAEKRHELEVTLIDQGKRVEDRTNGDTDKAYGVSGVGAFSDGKFIFETELGKRQIGTNLGDLIGARDREYLMKAKEFFRGYYEKTIGKIERISEERLVKAKEISRIAGIHDIDYIVANDYHIGTDKLPAFMKTIQDDLERRGIRIITEQRVIDFDNKKVYTKDMRKDANSGKEESYNYDFLLLAPGRDGSTWLHQKLDEKKIAHSSRPIDIGFRIETDAAVIKHLTDIERDVKFELTHPNGDKIRTFCVCPYGFVTQERKKPEFGGLDFCLVNGESHSVNKSNNTNFALLVRMPLREEGDNAAWGRKLAEAYKEAGVQRIVLQRYGDLKMQRSSKPNKVKEWRIQPTLPEEEYMVGDVRIAMYSRIMDDIRYAIDRLSVPGLMEGLNQDSTLLYGPEIKMHGINIKTTPYLESVSMPNLYLAGDGTGFTRGIGGSSSSGILAAEGILSKL
ncbi:FAD-dependent oxidoreductase [Candidatus Pacearchaeota archaeon]|nr:FAD-dependent oxidoreductase [Candidatus Pacearchaeota archaeon]